MRRILAPGQIETFSQRDIPRLRLPDRAQVFSARAARLRQQSEPGTIGHAIGDYLALMAHLAEAQHIAAVTIEPIPPTNRQIEHAHSFRMPIVSATSWAREQSWRHALISICDSLVSVADVAEPARDVCNRLRALTPNALDEQADALLAANGSTVDVAAAPFLMGALQVYWVGLASRLRTADVRELDVPGVCPSCGTLPVASVVRADSQSQGLRYLHCALCATEWHLVRVKCSHCQTTEAISYLSIDGGQRAIRAECCDTCHTYRKIFYQEDDVATEPVADDLASLSLDLLLSEAGYHRASPNPLLWT